MKDDLPRRQSSSLQWITEDAEWPEESPAPTPRPPSSPRRRWLPLLLVATVIIAGGFVLRRRLLNEIENTTAAVAEDVLATNALVDRAAAQRDADLLLGVLSGVDDAWTKAQLARVDRGVLLENRYLGLTLSETAPLTRDAVTVDADLQRAVVNVPRRYNVQDSLGMTTTATLVEPQIYRRGQDRWLLAPPTADDWGMERTEAYSRLVITYPARDAGTFLQLGPALNQAVVAVCGALQCPDGERFEVRFGTDPALHLDLTEPARIFSAGGPPLLPTPSLIGLPQDADGVTALQGLYMPFIIHASIVTDDPCCAHGLFTQAIRDYLLHALEIKPYPLTAADRYRLLDQPRSPDGYSGAWTASADPLLEKQSWPAVYAVVAFALKGRSPAGIVEALRSVRPETDLDQFFRNTAGHPAGAVIDAWYAFLSAPHQPTDQNVALVCRREENDTPFRSLLLRLEPERNRVTLEERFAGDVYASPARNGRVLLLAERTSNRLFESRLLLWRPGDITIVADPDRGDFLASYTQDMDPTEQRLILSRPDAPTSANSSRNFALLDVTTCREGSCPLQSLERYPTWSPGGDATLSFEFEGENRAEVWKGDADGQQGELLLEGVQWAFWIDDATIGIVDDQGIYQLQAGIDPLEIVSLEALWTELDNDRLLRSTRRNVVIDVIVSPAAPDQLFVHVFDPTQLRHGVVRVSRSDGEMALEVTSTGRWIELDLSEDGAWLGVAGYVGGRTPRLTLISTDGTRPHRELSLPTGDFDWSASGARVVTPLGDNVRVTDLESGANTVYPIDPALECYQTMWLAPGGQVTSDVSDSPGTP